MPELTVTVKIAERPYRLRINREEEENVRKAVASLNEKINQYAELYAYKDKQDLIAMVALQFATAAIGYEDSAKVNDDAVIYKLQEIDLNITNCLSKA